MPLILGLGAAGVVVLIVIIVLLASGSSDDGRKGDVSRDGSANQGGRRSPSDAGGSGEPDLPSLADTPLTPEEAREIEERIEAIADRYDYDEASDLVKQGDIARDEGRNTEAQRYWNRAERILRPMVEESNAVFEDYGGLDGVERAERWARAAKVEADRWEKLRAHYFKFLRKE